ncbi:MAG: alpha-2-macroglobulin domain protein [Clostridiales bacterium]|nr:alpha-2-macroglobulin domain protein [Clostridiales bacterium]
MIMSKYEMLNDCKIDVDSIKEIQQNSDQKDVMFNRVKSRVVFKQKNPKNFKKIFAAVALVAVACICILVVYNFNKVVDNPNVVSKAFEYSTISITPTKQMAKGVAPDTQFVITTQQDTTLKEIEKNISITPEREFEINKVKANEYILTTKSSFNQEEVINIIVQDEQGRICKSWAFQTEGDFRILDNYPADKEEYVPTSTGIEITFSDADVTNEEFKENVIIEPNINYTLKKYNSTFVVMSYDLQKGQVYKVTVKGELQNAAGQQLEEDYSFEFKTQVLSNNSYFNFGIEGTHTYTTNDLPEITIMSSQNKDEYVGTLYQFNSIEAYQEMVLLSSNNNWDKYTPDLSGMTIVQSFDIEEYVSSEYGMKKLILPNKLSKGYYVLAVYAKDGNSIIDYKIIQITDLSVYVTSDENSILVWVNDAETKTSVQNASVSIEINSKVYEMKTDNVGKAIFKDIGIDNQSKASIIVTTKDNKIFADLISNNTDYSGYYNYNYGFYYSGYKNFNKDYYMYMYTDRACYMPTDTVEVWGVLRPRSVDKTIPSEFSLVLQRGYDENQNDLYTIPIEISKDGTYSAKIPFEYLLSGYYNVFLKSELGIMYSRSINIEEYKKPIYLIDAESDKGIYDDYENDNIDITSQIKLYDGSPASNLALKLSVNFYDQTNNTTYTIDKAEALTDENGTVKYRMNFKTDGYCLWYPTYVNYSVLNDSVGIEEISTYGDFYVVFRDVMLTSIGEEIRDKFSININTNKTDYSKTDYSKVATTQDMPYNYYQEFDNIKGKAYDTSIRASVSRSRYEKISLGFEYDAIYNESVEKFEYNQINEYIGDFEINTVGGQATFDLLPAFKEEDQYYKIEYYYTDSQGRKTQDSQMYFNNSAFNPYAGEDDRYGFESSKYLFDSSESSKFKLVTNYTKPITTEGSLLYYTVSENINNINITNSKEIEIAFSEKLVPNYFVSGAYFDGSHVYEVEDYSMRYDHEEKRVNIEIETDKDKYAPSEKVNLAVRVLDKANKPITNASVCISVVDEAMFALSENDDDILRDLYQNAYNNDTLEYVSYIPFNALPMGGAEGGGGGYDAILRSNFKDTATFKSVVTDKNGYATIEVKLPDDITSWRITALAITDDFGAGNTKKNIIVTRDIYVNAIINSQYLVGDDIAVALRTDGENAQNGDEVEYEVKISDGNTTNDIIKKVNSKIGSTQIVNFGKLAAGNYSIYISTATKKYADAIKKEFSIVDSGINTMLYKEFNLESGINLNAKLYPVQLTFYNSEYSQYQIVLNSLCWNKRIRKDEKLSIMFFKNTLKNMGEEFNWITNDYKVGDIVDYDGGVGDLAFSTTNPEFTARLCAAYPEFFKNTGTIEYLKNVLLGQESTKNEVAAAYMGLAALKQPVLYDIKYLLEEEYMDELSRMYLIAGLALIGDTDSALAYYLEEIQPKLNKNAIQGTTIYEYSGSYDDKIYYTAIASITSSVLNTKDNEQIIKTIIDNQNESYLLLAEKMVYIRYFRPDTEGASEFEYTLDGKVIKQEMNKIGHITIQLSKEQFEKLNVKLISGNVDVMARYIGAISELNDTKEQKLKVEKTITSISPTEYIVTIKIKSPKNLDYPNFIIDDYIPSGARFSSIDDSTGNIFVENQEMQRTWGISDTGKVRIGE